MAGHSGGTDLLIEFSDFGKSTVRMHELRQLSCYLRMCRKETLTTTGAMPRHARQPIPSSRRGRFALLTRHLAGAPCGLTAFKTWIKAAIGATRAAQEREAGPWKT